MEIIGPIDCLVQSPNGTVSRCHFLQSSNTSSGQLDLTNQSIKTDFMCNCGGNFDRGNQTSVYMPAYIGAYIAILNSCIFLTGIVGNVLVVVVVTSFRRMHTSINLYLANLSLADLCILLVCQPVAISEFFNRHLWVFGPIVCKLVPVMEHTVLHCSVLTILVVNLERNNAICQPLSAFKDSGKSRQRARLIIPLIWLLSVFLSLPFIGMAEVMEVIFLDGSQGPVCISSVNDLWKQFFVAANFFVLFLFPVVLMSVLLIKNVQTLRHSNSFRRISLDTLSRRRSYRRSMSSILSRIDDGRRESQSGNFRNFAANGRNMAESAFYEREIISQSIKEVNEDNHASLSDVFDSNDIKLLSESDQKMENISGSNLLESSSCDQDGLILNTKDSIDGNGEEFVHNKETPADGVLTQDVEEPLPEAADERPRNLGSQNTQEIHKKRLLYNINESPGVFKKTKSLTSMSGFGSRKKVFGSSSSDDKFRSLKEETRRSTEDSVKSIRSSTSSHDPQIKILIVIYLYFVASYLPVRVFILFQVFAPSDFLSGLGLDVYFNILWTFRLIMYLHSALNPLIYSSMSSNFSNAIRTLLFSKRQKQLLYIARLPLTQLSMVWTWSTCARTRLHSLPQLPSQNRPRTILRGTSF